MGLCARLLVDRQELVKEFLPFIALFMLLGMLPGKYNYNKALRVLDIISACLVIIGTGLIVLHKTNGVVYVTNCKRKNKKESDAGI